MGPYEQLNDPVALTVFVLTLFFPVLVGLATMRRTKSQSDFLVGGRAMGKLVVALSAISSGRSSWLVLGFAGMAYSKGLGATWALIGYIVVELFQFIYIGRRLRCETARFGALTLLDYFDARFDQGTRHLLRITGGLVIAIFLTAYVAAQLYGGAQALSTALDLSLAKALAVSAILIVVYMVLGGYVAVAYNDAIRAVIMLVALIVLPVVALAKVGGLGAMIGALGGLDPASIDPFAIGAGAIIGLVGIGLGSPGQPHIVVRYMSIDDPDKLRSAALIGTIWNVLLGWGALMIGLAGRVMFPDVAQLPSAKPEMVYLALSAELFGPALYGLLVGGVFAAILSTADSQLLVVASTFGRDLYEKIIRAGTELDETKRVWLSRVLVLVTGAVATGLAYLAKGLIFWLVLFAWGGLGAALGPSLILSLYWKKTHHLGIFSGMVVGTATTVLWKLWLKSSTGIYELIPAFGLAFVTIVIVSLLMNARGIDAQKE